MQHTYIGATSGAFNFADALFGPSSAMAKNPQIL